MLIEQAEQEGRSPGKKLEALSRPAIEPGACSAKHGAVERISSDQQPLELLAETPFLFCGSIEHQHDVLQVVSLIAMVPDSEWRIPPYDRIALAKRWSRRRPSGRGHEARRILIPSSSRSSFFSTDLDRQDAESETRANSPASCGITLLRLRGYSATRPNMRPRGPQSSRRQDEYNPAESAQSPAEGPSLPKAQHICAQYLQSGPRVRAHSHGRWEHRHDNHGCWGHHPDRPGQGRPAKTQRLDTAWAIAVSCPRTGSCPQPSSRRRTRSRKIAEGLRDAAAPPQADADHGQHMSSPVRDGGASIDVTRMANAGKAAAAGQRNERVRSVMVSLFPNFQRTGKPPCER